MLFAAFALLWLGGWEAIYFGILRGFGLDPFRFPFLDTHALLSAAECQRLGIDVYVRNPCDALGRVHAYSPLWLSLIPGFLGTADTTAVGLGLDLLFILSLGAVFRPRSWPDIAVFAVAVFSPVTLFAVERGNNDLVIFLLLVAAALLWSRGERPRLFAYLFFIMAGLLKYYPMVLLVLLLRERWLRAFEVAIGAGVALALLILGYRSDIGAALANIPHLTYYSDAFSAKNLPFGIIGMIADADSYRSAALVLLLVLAGVAAARGWRTAQLLGPSRIDWTAWETRLLLIAGVLFPACFFTAHNIAYRCIYLLLAVPGLMQFRRSTGTPMIRRWASLMIAAALFLLWEAAIGHAVAAAFQADAPDASVSTLLGLWQVLFWLGRELVWWWLIGGFLGTVLCFALGQPMTIEVIGWLRRSIPMPARR